MVKSLSASTPPPLDNGAHCAFGNVAPIGRYFTYNALGAWLPVAPPGDALLKLGRQAFLGTFIVRSKSHLKANGI